MNWASYDSAGPCSSGPSAGAIVLRDFMLARYSEASDGGIFNCRTVRGSTSPSIHGEGRAWDMMLPVRNGRGHPRGHEAVRELGAHGRRLGIQSIIFDRTIWSARSPSGRPYTGVHPHYDHLHIELTREGGRRLRAAELTLLFSGGVAARIASTVRPTVRQGARGEQVKALQRNLGGLVVDGVFGPKTTEAVKKFQRANGLRVDGIVGRQTWGALGL
jgi:hypothetical protein